MYKLLAIASLLTITGCASIVGEKLQPVSVQTTQDNKELVGAGCTLKNDEGEWFVTTPGSVTIHKSTDDLVVNCKKDGYTAGNETVVSKSNTEVWGNILIGGGIGYIVDRNTGAGFNYPNSITVILRKIGDVVGLTTPAASPAPEASPTMQATNN
ncbi:MAG: hypothetical protein QNK15_03355 [Cycloclasticus sp.]|nr:hypothetical protein [Cycloclasticus sp.]